MSRSKQPELNAKHRKALALIEKGGLSLDSIAKKLGWKSNYIYHLHSGDTAHAGSVASLFQAECRKIDKKISSHIKNLCRTNKSLAHELIHKILKDIELKKRPSLDEKKLVGTLMNCLAKSTHNVEIGNLSYSYTKGFTAEQLVNEFSRLQTLAGSSSNRRAVSGSSKGRTRALPESTESGGSVEEE